MDFPPPHYPATATATTTTSSSAASFSSSLDSSPDDYSKICWNEYFDEKKDILLDNGDVRVIEALMNRMMLGSQT